MIEVERKYAALLCRAAAEILFHRPQFFRDFKFIYPSANPLDTTFLAAILFSGKPCSLQRK
jgi:hypothetical protein